MSRERHYQTTHVMHREIKHIRKRTCMLQQHTFLMYTIFKKKTRIHTGTFRFGDDDDDAAHDATQ